MAIHRFDPAGSLRGGRAGRFSTADAPVVHPDIHGSSPGLSPRLCARLSTPLSHRLSRRLCTRLCTVFPRLSHPLSARLCPPLSGRLSRGRPRRCPALKPAVAPALPPAVRKTRTTLGKRPVILHHHPVIGKLTAPSTGGVRAFAQGFGARKPLIPFDNAASSTGRAGLHEQHQRI